MSFEFHCPWCKSGATVRGAVAATWRFRLPCDTCNREMVITFDGRLAVDRVAPAKLSRSDDATVPFQTAMAKVG